MFGRKRIAGLEQDIAILSSRIEALEARGKSDAPVFCSFCLESNNSDRVTWMIAGVFGNICDRCVRTSLDILEEKGCA